MKALRLWKYHLKHAIDNILNDRLIHFISMSTMTLSLLLFGSFMLFFVNVNNLMMEWGQSLSMSVYVADNFEKKQNQRVESYIKSIPGAELKKFISKEQAKADLIEALGNQAGILDSLSDNPFPASYEILFNAKDIKLIDIENIKLEFKEIDGIEDVQYSEQWLERFSGIIDIFKLISLAIAGLLCIAVLLIITNTIKLTLYSRKNEIEILKLVGATDSFVKMPFLIEGIIQGFVGGILALSILFFIYALFSMKTIIIFDLPVLKTVFLPVSYCIFLILLSLILGLSGSYFSIGRFFNRE